MECEPSVRVCLLLVPKPGREAVAPEMLREVQDHVLRRAASITFIEAPSWSMAVARHGVVTARVVLPDVLGGPLQSGRPGVRVCVQGSPFLVSQVARDVRALAMSWDYGVILED